VISTKFGFMVRALVSVHGEYSTTFFLYMVPRTKKKDGT